MMKAKFVVGALILLFLALGGCGFLQELLPPEVAPVVQATTGELETGIRLTWNAVDRATSYRVFRAEEENGQYRPLAQTPYTSFIDQVGWDHMGHWYWYKVQACNDAGCGPESTPVRGYAGYPPEPPGNVSASDGDYPDKIVVTWDPVPGATQYEVLRDRTPGGGFNPIAMVTSTSYEDHDDVFPGVIYHYKVKAHNDWGFSLPSEADAGCVYPCPVP